MVDERIDFMKIFQSCWLLVFLLCGGCGQIGHWGFSRPAITGSGTVVSEDRDVTGFDRVSLAGAGRLTLIQGDVESLTITTDDNLMEHITSTVSSDGHLRIGPEQVSLRPTDGLDYVLRLRNISRLNLSGSLSAAAEALKAESIAFHISGSGNIRIGHLEADRAESHISGSGKVELAGHATSQELHVSGSGDYRAADLESEEARIRISGSGEASVWVSERLEASISGSGTVSYYGTPQASQSISGSGKMRALGAK
jgi:hypothetical protein